MLNDLHGKVLDRILTYIYTYLWISYVYVCRETDNI